MYETPEIIYEGELEVVTKTLFNLAPDDFDDEEE